MSNLDEIQLVIEILYSMKENIRRRILEIIFSVGEEGVSFKSIVNRGNIPPTTAAYHLKILVKAGLVEKEFQNIEGRRDYSFYHLTTLGDRAFFIMNEIYSNLGPSGDLEDDRTLPGIQIIPLRIGPRCISIDKIQG